MSEMRICFIGDSITLGQGDGECMGWPGRLSLLARKNGHDITVYNLGIRGDTSTDIVQRWRTESKRRLPGGARCGIVFMFGINDMAVQNHEDESVSLANSLKNAEAILSRAVAQHRCLWIGPTPVRKIVTLKAPHLGVTYSFDRQRNANLNTAYRNLAAKIKVPFLDLHSLNSGSREWRDVLKNGDGVHPTAAGHQYLANAIARWQAWLNWLE